MYALRYVLKLLHVQKYNENVIKIVNYYSFVKNRNYCKTITNNYSQGTNNFFSVKNDGIAFHEFPSHYTMTGRPLYGLPRGSIYTSQGAALPPRMSMQFYDSV